MARRRKIFSDADASQRNHEAYVAGLFHYENGNYNNAKSLFKEAIEYWPEDGDAWMALGNCYDALHKPLKAEASFRKALAVCARAESDNILYNLGNSLYDQARYEEAIETYLQISKGHRIGPKAQLNLNRAKKKRDKNET